MPLKHRKKWIKKQGLFVALGNTLLIN